MRLQESLGNSQSSGSFDTDSTQYLGTMYVNMRSRYNLGADYADADADTDVPT